MTAPLIPFTPETIGWVKIKKQYTDFLMDYSSNCITLHEGHRVDTFCGIKIRTWDGEIYVPDEKSANLLILHLERFVNLGVVVATLPIGDNAFLKQEIKLGQPIWIDGKTLEGKEYRSNITEESTIEKWKRRNE